YHQKQREQHLVVRPFSTSTLEILIMNTNETESKKYSPIVKNEGFLKVAHAIRTSTVTPQRRKANGEKPVVDIRYGLGQQLIRKSAYPDDFLAEVSAFIYLYNAENAQLRENKKRPRRFNVHVDDLNALTELVDEFGSKVVCNLLVAYGYASDWKPKEGEAEGTAESDEMNDNT
ncbi:MAG: hypothetical protein AAF639_35510, partial [Chloroflexota bacterium]